MRRPRLPRPAIYASCALLASALAAGCYDDPVPPGGECAVAPAQDREALAAWLARPLKTCALSAVFPQRATDVVTALASGDVSGWDAERVLDGADANGVRAFTADGAQFAAFGNFTAMPASVTRQEAIDISDTCDGAAAFSAKVELEGGICTVVVDGEVVFDQPLHPVMTVGLAAWPGITPARWAPMALPANAAPLLDGYEYVTLPSVPALDAFTQDPRRAGVIAGWFDVPLAEAEQRVRFGFALADELLTVDDLAVPPFFWGGGAPTIATRDEAAALRAEPAPRIRWHYSGALDAPTTWDSTIEVGPTALRYTGGQPRDNARAASLAAACAKDVIARRLAARPDAPAWAVTPIGTDWQACGRLTTALGAAIAADDAALAAALDLYADAARARYGVASTSGVADYQVPGTVLPAAVAAALVANAAPLRARAPSVTLDPAQASWDALRASTVLTRYPALAPRLASAVLDRAGARAFRPTSLAPLSATDAAAIAARLDAAPQPLSAAVVDEVLRQVTTWAAPTVHP